MGEYRLIWETPEGESDGMFEVRSSDGTVGAFVSADKEGCCIQEFTSYPPGVGHARRFLETLRKKFKYTGANGIGEHPDNDSWKFWVQMADKGLVDDLMGDEHEEVPPFELKPGTKIECWVRPLAGSERKEIGDSVETVRLEVIRAEGWEVICKNANGGIINVSLCEQIKAKL